ncbi:MAG TPA: alcohol dehydrogenase catalytic domain-containing protein [Candidatus Sulfotelmatobacter sp.]|jgi:L-iditol 2-dehydrogenase|nr:alcohol dehydrogenase catalytic domain-containing protein [Candidatus Sulfotelmatobacter sp.]
MSSTSTIKESRITLGPIPKTMRAGVYREKGIVRVEEVPVPDVHGHEVLIKVAACGVCGTDIKKIFQRYVEPPQILGHELAGTVVATGRGVTKFKPGDRVMSFHHIPCGTCFFCERRSFSQCKQYKTTGLTAGFTPNGGGFAEYVKAMPWVAANGIIPLPDNVTFEEATFIEPINTIYKAVQKARVAPNENVLVVGCGPIGLQLLMVAKLFGAHLFTSDPMPERRAKSLNLGAVESFDPSGGKLVEQVKARTEGRGVDAVLVAVAHPAVVEESLAAARPGGRILLFAANDPVTRIEFPAAAVGIDEKEILGSYSAAVDIQENAAALVLQKKLPVMEIVTHRFPLDNIQEALELAARPTAQSLKILIAHK